MSIFNTGVSRLRKNKVIPIFLTITNDYAKYAAVAISSLMKNASPEQYYRVIILYDKLSLKNRWRFRDMVTKNCAIEFKQMKRNIYLQIIMRYCATKTKSGDFYAAAVYYYRAFIARLFPQYDKAIYIDSDVVVLGDIGELFKIDLGENVIAARPDPKVAGIKVFSDYVENALGVSAQEYVNSGVLLMDLKKLRKMHYITKMTDLIREYNADLVAPDQDYLNVVLRGKIMYLDEKWNAQAGDDLPEDVKLVHYNLMKKPWFDDDAAQGDLFWEWARRTRFYGELLRSKAQYTVEDMEADEAKMQALLERAEELAGLEKPMFGGLESVSGK